MTVVLDEVIAYVALDDEDRARLRALHPVLERSFSAIADEFCAAALASPGTAALVSNPAHLERLRAALIDWMSSGLMGPYDATFVAKRSQIGRRHVEIGLAQHHMIAAMSVIRRAYRDRIVAAYSPDQAHVIGIATDKLLDIELAVMLQHYQLNIDAKLLASERQRRLEQVEAMRTLCAGLAHEVRNPLNSATLQLQLAERRLRRSGEDPKLINPIELASHEIDRLTMLLDEFLAFARPQALDPHPQDVLSLVREVVDHERPIAERCGARLTLVDDSGPIVAEIDSAKLRQIVDNLVCNAIEAVRPEGHVTVSVIPIEGQVCIRVSDDGAGISAAALPRIFEPFFSTKEGGTGMGMSIVHSFVALHRGTVEVSTSSSGTTFVVAVPRHTSTS